MSHINCCSTLPYVERASSTWAGSTKKAKNRINVKPDRLKKLGVVLEGARRLLERYSHEGIYFGVSVGAHL